MPAAVARRRDPRCGRPVLLRLVQPQGRLHVLDQGDAPPATEVLKDEIMIFAETKYPPAYLLSDTPAVAAVQKGEGRADELPVMSNSVEAAIAAVTRASQQRQRIDEINRRRASIERALRSVRPGSRLAGVPLPPGMAAAFLAGRRALSDLAAALPRRPFGGSA